MSKRRIPGITVYKPYSRWSYRLELEPDPLTGERRRENRSGFESEDAAWAAALASQAAHARGRHVTPSRRTVSEYLHEWLATVRDALKPSTHQNYSDYIAGYVQPAIGKRRLQDDLTVQVLNAFYRHLLHNGRRKPDNNSAMYAYWQARQDQRGGLGPPPREIAAACNTTIYAARAAVARYQRGRVPTGTSPGLAPKTVKNIHRMLHRAFKDAVAWDYLAFNPAEHASLPRIGRAARRRATQPWTVDELAAWLRVALSDRFAGMWVLAATTGMRRSELAGARRDMLDLEAGALTIEDTRVVVAGQAVDSDGKSDSGWRTISLDPFTVAALRTHVQMLDEERAAFGPDYADHRKLMCFEDGRMIHPDTITRRFNRLVDRAGARRIHLHDVRHTYTTLSMDAGIDPKIVSDRVGHSNMQVTFQVYTHRSTGRDREAAERIGGLIQRTVEGRNVPGEQSP
jgi:integrase